MLFSPLLRGYAFVRIHSLQKWLQTCCSPSQIFTVVWNMLQFLSILTWYISILKGAFPWGSVSNFFQKNNIFPPFLITCLNLFSCRCIYLSSIPMISPASHTWNGRTSVFTGSRPFIWRSMICYRFFEECLRSKKCFKNANIVAKYFLMGL